MEKATQKKNKEHRTGWHMLMKGIRVITIPPIMALLALAIIYVLRPEYYGSLSALILSIVFICFLPASGYLLQPLIPHFKKAGREGQRKLAMMTAVVGYVVAVVYALLAAVPAPLLWIYLTYFVSGLGIMVCNKLLHVRASGHACGVAGPVFLIAYAFGPVALLGILLLVLVFYVSLKMKRHTLSQLMIGTLISTIATLISAFCLHLMPWFALS